MTEPFEPTPKRGKNTSGVLTLRLAPSGMDWVDQVAQKHDVTKTEVIKAALAFAAKSQGDFNKTIKARNQ